MVREVAWNDPLPRDVPRFPLLPYSPTPLLPQTKVPLSDFNGSRHVYRIAIVGSGPRGLAVLERIAARLQGLPHHSRIDIYLIDSTEVGCGRIWRTDQDDLYRMNTVADEVTMFSGPRTTGRSAQARVRRSPNGGDLAIREWGPMNTLPENFTAGTCGSSWT